MSHNISQNKGPKKMGHMGMQKPHINTDDSMSIGDTGIGPLSPSSTKPFSNSDFLIDDEYITHMGAPYMSKNEPLQNYSNKYMEKKTSNINNDLNNIINKNNDDFSYINYNTDTLQVDTTNQHEDNNNLVGYNNFFNKFDNYGNNRDISLVNTETINTFENRFIKNPINKLQNDIDVTGSSVSNKINGSNLNKLDLFESIN
tara:strand:+ start:270 stop:872 length:603 start_codon:yes stop_codon:yes gene_type:complete